MSRTIDADKYKEDLWVGREYMDEDTLLTATNILDCQPTIEAVPLADIYRVIAGHSNYHGDAILAALTCIAEGKQVNPVKPIESDSERHGRWVNGICTACNFDMRELTDGENDLEQWVWDEGFDYCPNCRAKMDKEADDGTTD